MQAKTNEQMYKFTTRFQFLLIKILNALEKVLHYKTTNRIAATLKIRRTDRRKKKRFPLEAGRDGCTGRWLATSKYIDHINGQRRRERYIYA